MIVALNNKSNLNKEEFENYKIDLEKLNTNHQLILCPTFLNINNNFKEGIDLGAQNVSSNENGAYTGEISAIQLKSFGVKYVIVGHSERREYQKESLEEIARKIEKVLKNEMTPILCIGETQEERNNNKTEQVIREELETAIKYLTEEEKEKIIIAYEPIWSIGTGIIPTNEEIDAAFKLIKNILPKASILYGGSANEENIDILKQLPIIDGYLLGGLSLKVDKLKIFIEKLN